MGSLDGKVVMVTGATGNLGRACVAELAGAGARVALVDRKPERLREAFAKEIGAGHLPLAADLADEAAVGAAMAELDARLGRLDGLLNTVGGFRGGTPVEHEETATWEFLMGTNLRTVLFACRAAIPVMRKGGGGRIVNTAAGAGLTGVPGLAAYSASKAAVLRLTEALAQELKGEGFNVNAVLPGTIDTPQNREAMPKADTSKWVEPAAIAAVMAFLVSDAARAVNGAAIPVAGRG